MKHSWKTYYQIVPADNHNLFITKLPTGELQLMEKAESFTEDYNVRFDNEKDAKKFITKHLNARDFIPEPVYIKN